MSRSKRSSTATETVSICESGQYVLPNKDVVHLQPQLTDAIKETVIYSSECPPARITSGGDTKTRIEATDETTLSALLRLNSEDSGHLACLNFASAKNPGGGFLGGAEAQEESLARASALYPCLLAARAYYEENRACRTALYLDRVIWSPGVPFFRDDEGALLARPVLASVITAPAPNAGAVAANEAARMNEIEPTLKRRAGLVLDIAVERDVQTLVLGAWGCGVFRNDPRLVATVFAGLLAGEFSNAFNRIVFAIYDKSPGQSVLRIFRKPSHDTRHPQCSSRHRDWRQPRLAGGKSVRPTDSNAMAGALAPSLSLGTRHGQR